MSCKEIKALSSEHLPVPYDPRKLLIDVRATEVLQSQSTIPKSKTPGFNAKLVNLYDKKYVAFVGAEAFVLYGFDMYQDFASVDEYVYEGIERLTNQQFDSFADLSQKVGEYSHSFWDGMSENGINKISGHIGEVYAADHLEGMGASVIWPEASNQTGWDLIVNGHDMNVKLVSDYSSLSEHFAKYPDIPVIIPGDAAHIPSDVIHLQSTDGMDEMMNALASGQQNQAFVVDALNNDAIMSQTEQATDMLLGAQQIVDANIPVVTVLFSGWREISLLRDGHTQVTDSLKNFGLDVAGIGIGGAAGAQAGAMAGTLVFPGIGTAIGAIIGGIGGAIGGRIFSDKYKNEALNKALGEFKAAYEQMKTHVEQETEVYTQQVNKMKQYKQQSMNQCVKDERARVRQQIQYTKQQREEQLVVPVAIANHVLGAALEEMNILHSEIISKIHQNGWFQRTLFPSRSQLSIELASKELIMARKSITKYQECIQSKAFVNISELHAILAGFGVLYSAVIDDMLAMEEVRRQRETDLRGKVYDSQERVIKQRVDSMSQLASSVLKLKEETRSRMNPIVEKVKSFGDKVKIEARKLGIKYD